VIRSKAKLGGMGDTLGDSKIDERK